MRRRGQLIAMTAPHVVLAFGASVALTFDKADQHIYFGMLLFAVVMLLAGVVSYLHRLMYGEDTYARNDSREGQANG